MQSTSVDDDALGRTTSGVLRLIRPGSQVFALGLAVRYLIIKPAFANLPFGHWSRVLIGQINRGHYCFVIDDANKVRGFMGWALADKPAAEAWLQGRRDLPDADAKEGDCLIINAWSNDNADAYRVMLGEARRIGQEKDTVYFKRHYANGEIRLRRIKVNEFVINHLLENSDGSPSELVS